MVGLPAACSPRGRPSSSTTPTPSPAERAPRVELARGAGVPVRAEEGFDRVDVLR